MRIMLLNIRKYITKHSVGVAIQITSFLLKDTIEALFRTKEKSIVEPILINVCNNGYRLN